MHYPWHPARGTSLDISYIEHRRGEQVAVCALPDGGRGLVPLWMLDASSCALMTLGAARASLKALMELRMLLTQIGSDVRSGGPDGGQEYIDDEGSATSQTTDISDREAPAQGTRDPGEIRRSSSAWRDTPRGSSSARGRGGNSR